MDALILKIINVRPIFPSNTFLLYTLYHSAPLRFNKTFTAVESSTSAYEIHVPPAIKYTMYLFYLPSKLQRQLLEQLENPKEPATCQIMFVNEEDNNVIVEINFEERIQIEFEELFRIFTPNVISNDAYYEEITHHQRKFTGTPYLENTNPICVDVCCPESCL
ncbi:hypothetical protein CSKR_200634 [Clonorchis sinensis]|uniref:Uncharacterized protein n=1 Tax=Clonorchis sinensis TaxID=79923 RepID=A0A8T1MGV4_CLOSI|nr:hypothetical protein CSKR_200634 [Clonorchis sinensis]